MAISPLSNIIFINQNMHVAASAQNGELSRYEFQNIAAQTIANEERQQIEKTRPPEESDAINPDKEHARQRSEEEQKRRKKTPNPPSDKEENPPHFANGHLDLRV